jgi:hypothetical protein
MPFLVYFVVLLIAGGSMLFGLDWLSSPMSPMPAGKPAVHTANRPAPPPVTRAEAKAAPRPAGLSVPAASPSAVPAAVAVESAPPVAAPPAAIAATAADQTAEANAGQPAAEEKAQAKCDVNACTAAYRSFTASDCTYQPTVGPRRLCTKGVVANDASERAAAAKARADTSNVSACSAAYGSFNAADCTYQPYDGPRRLCEK